MAISQRTPIKQHTLTRVRQRNTKMKRVLWSPKNITDHIFSWGALRGEKRRKRNRLWRLLNPRQRREIQLPTTGKSLLLGIYENEKHTENTKSDAHSQNNTPETEIEIQRESQTLEGRLLRERVNRETEEDGEWDTEEERPSSETPLF